MLAKLLIVLISFAAIESKIAKYVDTEGQMFNLTDEVKSLGKWVASAHFEDNINTTGWAQLDIESNPVYNESLQAYAMGLIEGYLTSDLIENHYNNLLGDLCNDHEFCDKLFAFLNKNMEFTKSQIQKYGSTDPYWHQIDLSLNQLVGIEDGYRAMKNGVQPMGPRNNINVTGLILLNIVTEIGELSQLLNRSHKYYNANDGHCSAIVKVLEDGSDLFVSHNTWTMYSSMLRIMKKYNYSFRNISGNSVAFSSYPATIYSIDDFYLISSGLTVLETSIGNYNKSLWKNIVADKVVLEFIRNTVANRLASSGKEWAQTFSKYNSGTYNNQFMIIDYKLFQRSVNPSNLSDNLLWILEQLPGYVESADVTHVLRRQHYWPSYNVPYFPSIYQMSDYESQVRKYGNFFTYNNTARALIFKRDQHKAVDIPSLYKLMRYNDFKHDPLSRCNCSPPYTAKYAIADRSDLDDPNGIYPIKSLGFKPQAAIDVKLTNSGLFSRLEMVANSGPTYDQLPPFQWSTSNLTGVRHMGQPDLFKFPAVYVKWSPASQVPLNLK